MIKTETDLQLLIGMQESRTMDFKQKLAFDEKKGKGTTELCRDVSAFANTIGGQIIYGMTEEKLKATELVGLSLDDPDEIVQKIENKIKDMIEPRIPGINISPIELTNSKHAIVINIPKSWLGPHGFKFDKGWRFYIRGSSQTNFVSIDQQRDLFIQSDQLIDRIRTFRNKRISEILAEAISIPLDFNHKPKLVIHIVPTIAFSPSYSIDLSRITEIKDHLRPIFGPINNYRFNFDGFVTYSNLHDLHDVSNYLQLFRNGIVESLDTYFIDFSSGEQKDYLGLPSLEAEAKEIISNVHSVYKSLNIHSPFFVFISLLNVRGKKASVDTMRFIWFTSKEIDRDHLLFPEVLFEIDDQKLDERFEDLFLPLWNSFGSNQRLI